MTFSAPDSKTICNECKTPLLPNHTGPCPKCGKVGKSVTITPHPTSLTSFTKRLKLLRARRQEIIKENPNIKAISNGISIIAVLIVLLLSVTWPVFGGIIGPLISLLCIAIANRLLPLAMRKIITIEKEID